MLRKALADVPLLNGVFNIWAPIDRRWSGASASGLGHHPGTSAQRRGAGTYLPVPAPDGGGRGGHATGGRCEWRGAGAQAGRGACAGVRATRRRTPAWPWRQGEEAVSRAACPGLTGPASPDADGRVWCVAQAGELPIGACPGARWQLSDAGAVVPAEAPRRHPAGVRVQVRGRQPLPGRSLRGLLASLQRLSARVVAG